MTPDNLNLASQQAGRQYYPALDGLRGLAILLVVVYHNFGFIDVFFFGWLGVDLFFVLSGFLITDILLRSLGKKDYLKNFYIRRILRIFPLYYLCLILFLIVVPRLNMSLNVDYYRDNQVWLWTYLQNWLFIFKDGGQTQALHHLWSLGVEEQFYLIWPLAILVIKKPKHLLLILGIVLISVISLRYILWIYKIETLAYFNLYTFSRVDGICIGSMLALVVKIAPKFLEKSTTVIVLILAGFNFLFYFFNRYYDFTFPYLAIVGYTTFAILFALLVNEGIGGRNKLINFIFNNPLMKFFGRISYGLYIYHWPVYLLARATLQKWSANNVAFINPQILAAFLSLCIAILISIISYRYFESIFFKWKQKFG
jgi:peptidoglycan/LPS O-acetylase OafA/YrhL